VDSYSFTHEGAAYDVARVITGGPADAAARDLPFLREVAACAEILALAEQRKNLFQERAGQDDALLKAMEERDSAKITAEEGQEIIGELSMALAVLTGDTLTTCDTNGEDCRCACPGHLSLKASEVVNHALAAYRALQEGNRQAVERIKMFESIDGIAAKRIELMEEQVQELTNLKNLHRAVFKPLEAEQRDGENLEETLARIIRERDGYLKGRESALADARAAGAAAEAALQARDSWRGFGQRMHRERDAVARENREKCLELAENAEEIRELRAVVDAAAAFVKEVDEVRAVASGDTFDELRKRLAAKEPGFERVVHEAEDRYEGSAQERIDRLVAERDAEMERVKACEHIAEGEPGWEVLRNLCPSTAAVATLRDRLKLLALLDSEEPPREIMGLANWYDPPQLFVRAAWRWLREQVHGKEG
jgi:hypothetical protein